MEQIPEKESVFISGIDNTITEADLIGFFSEIIKSDFTITIHNFSILNKPKAIGEAVMTIDDSILAHQKLNNTKLKNCYIKLLPKSTMKSLIITNLPDIMSEKDLFLLLNKTTAGLRRIIMADDPEVCGKTANLAVASYQSYEHTKAAFETLKVQNKILGKTISAVWKEPHYDIIGELALETRVIYIKNISTETDNEKLKNYLGAFGNIVRVKKYMDRAFVEFDSIAAAKKAIEQCNEKRFDSLAWKISPAKRFDEEKSKEKPDKNIIFSKNFLEEEDQQILLKFAYDGTIPEVNAQAIQTAKSIIEAAKKFQNSTKNDLKQRYDNLVAMKNTISTPTNVPTQTNTSQQSFERRSSNQDFQNGSYPSYQKQSKPKEKMFSKQQFKEQRQHMGGPIGSVPSIGQGLGPDTQKITISGIGQQPPQLVNSSYPVPPNPYDQRTMAPVEYGGNVYYNMGQNPYMVQGQWNPMASQQLNPMQTYVAQPQFYGMNPAATNTGYINPTMPPAMGGMQPGQGYGTGYQGQQGKF